MSNENWSDIASPVASEPDDWSDVASPVGAATAKKQNKGILGDIGTGLKRGVEQMPGMVTGIADIAAAPVSAITGINRPFSRAADYVGEKTGFQPAKWAEQAAQEYSPETQQSLKAVEQADGFTGTLKAIGENPRSAVNLIAESLPSTLAGGILARGAMGAVVGAEKLAAMKAAGDTAGLMKAGAVAGGIGEGAVTAGQQMSQTDYNVDPLRAAGSALAAGAGTGIIGGVSGRIANKIGLADIEGSIAAGTLGAGKKAGAGAYAGRIAGGAVQEGALEEMPQSAQEQVWQNVASSKPWDEGVGKASAQGLVAGMAMGAGVNALPGGKRGDVLPADSPAAKDLNQSLGGDVSAAPTLTTDIDPMHADLINRIIGVGAGPMDDKQRAQYEKDLAFALDPASPSETVGYTTDANGIEIPFTMRDYVASTVRVADMTRDQPKAARANVLSADRLAELGAEESTQQPDIAPGYVAPVIPVVGPLSAIANAAVQSGAHQTAVMQQAAAEQAKAKPAGPLSAIAAQSEQSNGPIANQAAAEVATPGAQVAGGDVPGSAGVQQPAFTGDQTGISGGAEMAAPGLRPTVPAGIAGEQAPNAVTTAPNLATQPPNVATPAGAFDVSGKNLLQLKHLAAKGQPGWKEAATAELARLNGSISETVPALNAVNSINSPAPSISSLQDQLDKTEPFSEQSQLLTERLQLAVTDDAKSAIGAGEMPVYKVTDHVSVAIHPSAQKEGMIQVTRYTKDGVIGDSQYNSIDEAVRFEGLTHKPRIPSNEAIAHIENSIAAEAEYQKRKNEQQAGAGLPASTAGGSRPAPVANQEPVKNQSEQPLDMVPSPIEQPVPEDYKGHLIYQSEMAGGKFMVRKKVGGELVGRGFVTAEEARATVDAVSQPKTGDTEKSVTGPLRITENADMGQFTARTATGESMGSFQIKDGKVANIKARAQWAMDDVRAAAEEYAKRQSQPKTDTAPEAKQDKAPVSNRFERKWPLSVAEAEAQGIIVSGHDANRNATRWGVGDNWSSSEGNFATAGEALDHYYQVTKPNDEASAGQQAERKRSDALAEFKDKKAWPVFKDIEAGTIDYVDLSNGEIVTMTISAYRQQVFNLEEQFGTPSKSIGSMEDLRAVSAAIKQAKQDKAPVLASGQYVELEHESSEVIKGAVISALDTSGGNVRYDIRTGTAPDGYPAEQRTYSQNIKRVMVQREATPDEINGKFGNDPKPTGAELLKARIEADKAKASDTDSRFANNKIFTADKVAAAKARMKAKLGTMNSGIDPELLIDGMTIAGAYIESGVRKFSDYAKAMVDDLGDGVKPYLLSFYEAARAYPGLNKLGMDSAESAASQHQALLTPEVKEAAKAVIGQAPKVDKKKPANLGEAVRLKADWGVQSIDGYTKSKTGKNQQTDAGLSGGVKDEFLADATRYLKSVAKILDANGFAAQLDSKGKPFKVVTTGEGGPAVGGDVYLRMSKGGFEAFAQVGVTNIRGMGPAHPQGVSLMTRVGERIGMNNWLATDLSAGDLSAWFDKQYQAFERRTAGVAIPAASAKLEVKNESLAPTSAPAIGEANNGTATGKQGNQALEGMAAESVQGTAGREPTGDSGSGSGSGRGQGNQGTDAGRGETGRSGGSGASEVDTAAAGGTGPGRPGLGSNGTDRQGSRVPKAGSKPEGSRSNVPTVAASDVPAIPEVNFEITEDVALGSGGQMTKYRDNIAAIKALKTIETERRRATAAEKKLLARYVGWGGIPNAFRNGVTKQVAKDWEKEVAELESLLTPKELRAAAASTRNAHYTAKEVVDFMWSAVKKMGFDGGLVLEPSVGTGNFIGLMPKEFAGKSFVTGVELDNLTARIASALYPKSSIVNAGFQNAALPSNRFKLAIGNPPFGSEGLRFQYRPELNGASIHNQFFLGSMDSLEPGGIMTMVVSRYLLDAKDATSREKLAIDARLMGAIRLPGSAFKGNALTEVVTDVLFFRKRDPAEAQLLREAYFKRGKPIKGKDHKVINELQAEQSRLENELRWTKTGEVKDPMGGAPMVVSQHFVDHPSMVIGTMDRSGTMREGGDIEVSLPKGEKLGDRLNAILDKMQPAPVMSLTDEALANAEKFHKAMGESLKLAATGAEADAITFDEDGDLTTVVERVGAAGETALSPLKITAATPWSTQLQMDMDGKWFREVTPKDKAGNALKVLDAKGNPTKRNQYVREVFKKESDIPKGLLLGEARYAKMKDLITLRDLFVNQIDLEVSRATPAQMEANRAELRNAYEAFVKANGFISDQKNAAIISDMPDEGLLMSLEMSYKPEVTAAKAKSTGMPAAPASAKQAAILSRPVAIPPASKTSADSAVDGLAISMSETGRIDLVRIAELRGLSEDEAMEELVGGDSPMAFKDPESGNELVEKNAYLSGNVRRKLEAAKLANLSANVKALESVQPEMWSSDKVTARAGANWIPAETYGEFLSGLLGDTASVQYSKLTNTFEVRGEGDSAAATATWGTKRESAVNLYQDILNSRSTRVVDRDSDGRAVFNQVETDAANDKRKEIVEAFNEWIFKNPDRRAALTQLFNDTFNTRVTPQYDGSHLAFPGKVPDEIISLRRGQVNAVWRGIIEDAVLYDHAVGAGKTFTGIARAMERRRMGMSKKPMVVVPNHMVGEWAAQAYRLYPSARVLAATKKDLESKNRRRLFAKIASGDWDMVIVPHSSFQFIAISPETEERLLSEELSIANKALSDAEAEAEPGSRFKPLSVKAAEALIEKIEKRLEAARGRLGKDKLLTFEQMGVDDLTIDEAHEFKNLFYSSNLTDVRGMGNKTGSDKAFDLYSKTRVIREMGGSMAFLTGTPISNSAVEAYNILRYLAPESLKESGLEHFDAFRSQYVDATAKFEPTDSGGGLKLVTRLGRSWSNMRSLMELYYSVADVVTNDDIKRWYAEDNPGKEFPLPKVKSGDRIPVPVDATPTQMRLLQETIAAFDALPGIEDIKERNAERLRLMDRARKLSLHAKAVDPTLDDEPGGKLDKVAEKAAEIHRKSADDKGTQLIFLDRGVPKSKGDDKIIKEYDELTEKLRQASLADNEAEARKLVSRLDKFDTNEIEELRAAQISNWSGYQHIKDRLIEQGVPANEIAFVQDFNGDAAKEQLFQAVRDGTIRILIGSTPRMGAGTNVQERLVALHHVDATWKPSDIEQREGRIIRQGNALLDKYGNDFEVEIYAYVTKRTVDAKLWDLNATKLRMINAIRYYDGQFEMDFDDEAAVGMAEIAAIASGDPLLLERFKLSTEIDNLYRGKNSHRRRVESAEDSLRAANQLVENAPKEMAESKEGAKLRSEFSKAIKESTDAREVTMAGKRYVFGDIGQINVDYAKIVDGIGDDEKFSLVIDGKEYTSKSAAEDAIKAAMGDVEAFVAKVGGKTFIRRSDYARAIREKIGDEIADGQVIEPVPMGSIGGIPVSVEIGKGWGGPSIFLGLTGKFESTGRRQSVVGHKYLRPEKHKSGDPIPLSVNALRPVISDFEKSVNYLWDQSEAIATKAEKAKQEIPAFEAQIGEAFKGQADLDSKADRLATVEAELSGRKAAEEAKAEPEDGAAVGNIAATGTISPADKAIYGMSAEGKSAAEILKFIAASSRNPFYRQLAKLLQKTGIAPSITVGDGKGWKMNAGEGNKYAAGYNPKTDTISLFRPASAERNMLHEMMHAATLKALAKKGMASAQMNALYAHVKKTGKLKGMYGMSDVDEFIAESFSNPKFQAMLKQVSAAPVGGKPSSAWDWFIRVVRGILGLKQGQDNALSQALDIGVGVMRENMRLQSGDGVIRFNHALRSTPEGNRPLNATRLAELRRIAAGLERPKDAVFLRVTEDGKAITTGPKGVRIPETFIRFAESNGLDFEARRNGEGRKSGNHTVGDHITSKTEPMPEEYRESGALYFGEGNEFFDRTGKTRYNAAPGKINQTDTEAFRKWFGSSKVVDANGEPLVVYHGTEYDFTQFSQKGGLGGAAGFWFASTADAAGVFAKPRMAGNAARIMPAYLSLRNPAEYSTYREFQNAVADQRGENHEDRVRALRRKLARDGRDGIVIVASDTDGGGIRSDYVAFNAEQIKSAIGNNGDFDASNPDIRYNVADEGWSVSEQAKETVMRLAGRPMLDPSDPFAAENARLREQDQSLWSKAKKQLRRYLAPGGLLPQSVFAEKIKRDSEFQAVEFDVRHLIGGLEQAVKADFGMAFDKLSKEQMRPITEALAGNVPASLPEVTKTAAVAMRQYIDGMSTEYLKIVQQKIDAKMLASIESGKDADKAQAINEIELFEKIKGNIGRYVHRSYQAFDDPKWFEKVPASVLNASRLYLKQGYMEAGETDAKAAQLAEVTLHEILKNGTAYDSMESFIAESKLGAKDLSVLMRRKEVPAQIRALLGEYPDARLNFTKSATKMGRLIWNTRFLDRVRDIGMGSFFFEGKDRPANATTQIAADGSEVYAPLNGLWTFPEIAQSFKDALGKEQMSDLYRAIVRANGLVKYGKTVLAPTTAMRNWQSAMFFSLANGHFDLTQMKKSISAFREQVSQKATGWDLKYLRHLKQLGVVYDTPYAGEMARLMEDARMEELLSSDKGDAVRWFRKANAVRWFRKANQLAQGFYTFGDDFWKIIGFENEKAGLMKAGLSLQEAEIEAAKRIRDTYPTYSMVGRGIQWLSRFPLAGTFVSFPAEIIRTSSNMLRTVASDLKSDNPKLRELGMKRAAGMALVSAGFYALAALSMAMAGVGDDEDEAIRDLAPEWQKNSTFLYLGRDEKGNLRYFDMSFLDPYGYWKRPITAMLRDQPWEDSLASGLRGMLEPFLGADIAAKAIFEAVANQKESGSKVYKEKDGTIDQAVDIADHLRKALQPGVAGNVERLVKASTDVRRSSGQPYSVEDELVALVGWRATTVEPKTALYYRSFEFTDSLAEARKTLTDTLRDANDVSPEDIKDAKERAKAKQDQAFSEMQRLVGAAESAGMSKMQIVQTLRLSNISQANIASLMRGATPDVSVTPQLAARAVRQASQMRGPEFAAEVFDRYRQAMAN